MNVEFYERIWMWAAVGLLVIFLGTIALTAANDAVHPPSHVETVDPAALASSLEDPGISAGWKLAHTVLTYSVVYPSLVTAFTIIASLEVAGRIKGAKGLFNWIGRLPWSDPFFASVALAMIAFIFGGFGGAINAAYAMNAMVHNTAWIQGHFHVTLGTTVALTFMGATYWLLPRMSGRDLRMTGLARIQPYLWLAGMLLFSTSYHIAGLRGLPRRIYSASLTGDYHQWHGLSVAAAVGAVFLFISALSFVTVVVATWLAGRRIQAPAFEFASSLRPPSRVSGIGSNCGRQSRLF